MRFARTGLCLALLGAAHALIPATASAAVNPWLYRSVAEKRQTADPAAPVVGTALPVASTGASNGSSRRVGYRGLPLREPTGQALLDRYFGPGVLSASDDLLADGTDALWRAGAEPTTTLLFEMAGNAPYNVFGIYDPTAPDFRLPLFYGYSGPGAEATVALQRLSSGGYRVTVTSNGVAESARFGSSVFGFYLRTPGDRVYFSDSQLNEDGFDHLRVYGADGTFLLAWEDQWQGGNLDFNDMGIRLTGFLPVDAAPPAPIPLPPAVALLGTGLVWLAGWSRRRGRRLSG